MEQIRVKCDFDWNTIKDRVFPRLHSTSYHEFLIDNYVQVPVSGDIVQTFAFMADDIIPDLPAGDNNCNFCAITTELADHLGITVNDLIAATKHPRMNYTARPLSALMAEMTGLPEEECNSPLWCISNKESFWGASGILYPDIQEALRFVFKEDYFVLPSSVHEVLACPKSYADPDWLGHMVCEINETQVLPPDRLSDHVYEIKAGKLCICE